MATLLQDNDAAEATAVAGFGEARPVFSPTILTQATEDLASSPEVIDRQLDEVQREMDALRAELTQLRRRDEALNFYMHRLDEELRLAARLQQDFLPKVLPQLGRIHFHTLFRPAGYVSGDLYDVMRLDERRVGFYIVDAVGHGIPAALLTMFLKQALATKEIAPGSYRLLAPSETLARLNAALVSQNLSQATFATALYGHIDIDSLEVTFARGGHPIPVVLRADGSLQTPESEGGLLGIFPEEQYADRTLQLAPGDRMVLFTDGVEVGFGGAPPMDITVWHRQLHELRSLPCDELIAELSRRMEQANGSKDLRDDLTVVVMEVK